MSDAHRKIQTGQKTLAIGDANGKGVAVRIAAVKLIGHPSPGNQMVDLLWEGLRWQCTIDLELGGYSED